MSNYSRISRIEFFSLQIDISITLLCLIVKGVGAGGLQYFKKLIVIIIMILIIINVVNWLKGKLLLMIGGGI